MYTRTDAIDDVVAIARNYYTAMLDADEAGLRALFHDRAIIAGNFEGVLEFSDLGVFWREFPMQRLAMDRLPIMSTEPRRLAIRPW